MKKITLIIFFAVLAITFSGVSTAFAQCSVCSTNVASNAKSGATTTNGLNSGILYLLAAPYLLVALGGFLWYRNFRRKNVDLQVPTGKIHLN
jgi:hypothetical protein